MSDCRFGVSPVNYPDPDLRKKVTVLAFFLDYTEMSIMCRHLLDNRSGRLANFVRLVEFLADLHTGNFMSDIRSDRLAQRKSCQDCQSFAWQSCGYRQHQVNKA